MPNIRSAKKKVRKDKKRTTQNAIYLKTVQSLVKSIQKSTKGKYNLVKKAYAAIDKAAKKKILHKNKAARLKSKVSKLALKK